MPGQLNFSLQLGGGFSMFQALLQLFPKKGTTGEYLLESILSDMTGQRAKKGNTIGHFNLTLRWVLIQQAAFGPLRPNCGMDRLGH